MKNVYRISYSLVSGQNRSEQPRAAVIADNPTHAQEIISNAYPQSQVNGYETLVTNALEEGDEGNIKLVETEQLEGFDSGARVLLPHDPFRTGHTGVYPGTGTSVIGGAEGGYSEEQLDQFRRQGHDVKDDGSVDFKTPQADASSPAAPIVPPAPEVGELPTDGEGEARSPISEVAVPPETGEPVYTSRTGGPEETRKIDAAAVPKAELNRPMPHRADDFPEAAKPVNSGDPEISPVVEHEATDLEKGANDQRREDKAKGGTL